MAFPFGRFSRKQCTRHGIVASLQYDDEDEACLAFTPMRYSGDNAQRPVTVIHLRDLWKYAEDEFLVKASTEMCENLGFGLSPFTRRDLAFLINDLIVELCAMPPLPMNMKNPAEAFSLEQKADNHYTINLEAAQ